MGGATSFRNTELVYGDSMASKKKESDAPVSFEKYEALQSEVSILTHLYQVQTVLLFVPFCS